MDREKLIEMVKSDIERIPPGGKCGVTLHIFDEAFPQALDWWPPWKRICLNDNELLPGLKHWTLHRDENLGVVWFYRPSKY
jgi:hypothetical protein